MVAGERTRSPSAPGNWADLSAAHALLDKMRAPIRLLPDRGHDANSLRARLAANATEAVIPSTRSRKRPISHDATTYADRNMIECAFRRLKDRWRIATRYDNLAITFASASAVAIAALILWWT
jgi:transposase